jgi:hypothetical protein
MAKTNSDKIDELSQLMATTTERLDNVRRDVDLINTKGTKNDEALSDLKKQLAVIDERLTEMRKGIDIAKSRWWALVPTLIGVITGGAITFLGQLAIHKFFP